MCFSRGSEAGTGMKGQLTGMRGVYLVAAELARRGFIASPTSRSAIAADILVTDQACTRTYSVQVKTNARTFDFWLVGKRTPLSDSHMYGLVNLRPTDQGETVEYFIVPSSVVANQKVHSQHPRSEFWSLSRRDIVDFRDSWELFGDAQPLEAHGA